MLYIQLSIVAVVFIKLKFLPEDWLVVLVLLMLTHVILVLDSMLDLKFLNLIQAVFIYAVVLTGNSIRHWIGPAIVRLSDWTIRSMP